MKRTILFSFVLTGLLLATALSYSPVVPTNARAAASPPASGVSTVPLYQLYAPSTGIHFYTIDVNRKQEALGSGWNSYGIAAHILDQQAPGTVPLYVLVEKLRFDHEEGNPVFGYTTSEQEKDQLQKNPAVNFLEGGHVVGESRWHLDGNGIAGYIASTQLTGTVPLYHLYHPPVFGPEESERENPIHIIDLTHFRKCLPSSYDAFYTINEDEKNKALSMYGYKFFRIEGYVWPQATTVGGLKLGPGKPVGDADTVLLKWGCTRPGVGSYNCPTIAGYEACENYRTKGDVKACSTSANQKVQAAMEKELFYVGCSRFLNRPDEFLCKTQKSFDLCEFYNKKGLVKKCLISDANKEVPKQIGPGKPVDPDTVLLNWGCTRSGEGVYGCPTQAAYERCESYRITKSGNVKDCWLSADPKPQADMEKELYGLGCSRFMGKPDDFVCKTQKSLDACNVYIKKGLAKRCRLTTK